MQHVLISWLSRFVKQGQLVIQIGNEQKYLLSGQNGNAEQPKIGIRLKRRSDLLRVLLRPDPTFGELYVDGQL